MRLEHISEDKLTQEIWDFNVNDRLEARLVDYRKLIRPTTRHQFSSKHGGQIWSRYADRDSNIPKTELTEELRAELIKKMIAKIKFID